MRSLLRTVAKAAGDIDSGEYAVVCLGAGGARWAGTTFYASAAFGMATKLINRDGCNAYVVKQHSAGRTVYLSPDTILGTVAPPVPAGPMPTVTYDGNTYKVRSRKTEIPDLGAMPRMAALQWLCRETYRRGYSKAPSPLAGLAGAIGLTVR